MGKTTKYRLFVVCIKEENNDKIIIRKGVQAECNFPNDEEALEGFYQIFEKDLIEFFDRVFCAVSCGGVRIGTFRFPEKRA